MSKPDWNTAPKWATRYGSIDETACPVWADDEKYTYVDGQQGGGEFNFSEGFGEDEFIFTDYRKEWRGPEDGLPPVGTKCEVRTGYATEPYSYEECDIIAHFMGTSKMCAAYTTVNHDGSVMVGQGTIIAFRSLRTEEDKAVEELKSYIDDWQSRNNNGTLLLATELYRVGYRKQDASE